MYTYNEAGITFNGNSSYNGQPVTIVVVTPLTLAVNRAIAYNATGYTYNDISIPYNGAQFLVTVVVSDMGVATTQVVNTLLNSPTILTVRNVTTTAQGLVISAVLNSPIITAIQNFNISLKPKFVIRDAKPNSYIFSLVPQNQLNQSILPQALANQTGGGFSDNGLTYNQAGYTYNDIRGSYGGAYGQQTVFDASVLVKDIAPRTI